MMVWTDEPAAVGHMSASYGEEFRRTMLARNWRQTTHLLHTSGDANLQYGNRGIGILDWYTSIIFVLGLGIALARIGNIVHWPLLLVLFLNVLLGGVLAMDGVQYSRLAGIAVIIVVVPALWGRQLMVTGRAAFGRRATWPIAFALAAGVVLVGLENHRYTFDLHDDLSWSDAGPWQNSVQATIARNIRDWGAGNFTFVHSELPGEFWQRQYEFITADRMKMAFESGTNVDLAAAEGSETITFVVPPDDDSLMADLQSRFPGGREMPIEVEFHDPDDVARVYRITSTDR
jgi:hypothetical protein